MLRIAPNFAKFKVQFTFSKINIIHYLTRQLNVDRKQSYLTAAAVSENKLRTEEEFNRSNFESNGKNSKTHLLSTEDYDTFIGEYPHVVHDLVTLDGLKEMTDTNDWLQRVCDYNLPHGKLLRPMILLAMAKLTQLKTGQALPNLNRIAWSYEFFQGFATIHDDMMDQSLTRRDQPCWYLVDNLGPGAINDGSLLCNAGFVLFRKYARAHYRLYSEIVGMIHDTFYKGLHGQCLDSNVSRESQYDKFNSKTYRQMMTFKNGYYTFYTPIALALMLNGVNGDRVLKKVEKLTLDFGLIYSVQDDFIDCYVDESKSGKIGTDIQDGKPTWLFVTALEHGNRQQRQILLNNYGQHDDEKIAIVKRIYDELNLPGIFSTYEDNFYNSLSHQIEQLPEIVPREPFNQLIALLGGRNR